MKGFFFLFVSAAIFLASFSTYWFLAVDANLAYFLGWFSAICGLTLVQSYLLGRRNRISGAIYLLLTLGFVLFFVQSPKLSGHTIYLVSGNSNCPTICNDDFGVIRTKSMSLTRGEFIIFESENKESYLVKRIHAVPGDTVHICNTDVYVNGFRFSKKNDWLGYAFDGASKRCSSRNSHLILQDNEYFVLGDGDISLDSRHFGVINRHQIFGQIIYKVSSKTGLQSVSIGTTFSFPANESG